MARALRLLVCGLAVVAAPLLVVQGMANARIDPRLVDLNGFWKADVAGALVQVEQLETSLELDVNETGFELARGAFADEPLASDAFFPIAIAWQSDGRTDDANALIETGLRLDKRNRQLGVLALQREVVARNLPGLFDQINRLSVLNPQLINDFVQPLTAEMGNASAVPVIREALVEDPVWAEAFWLSVPRSPEGARGMYSLRQDIDNGVTAESDERLLAGLANAGLHTEALAHWDARFAEADAAETVFFEGDDFAPIGWRSERSGNISFSRRGEGEYDIYVENQSSGELARQLVRLAPGTYRFSADVSPASDAEFLNVSLVCANGEGDAAPAFPLGSTVTFTSTSACDVYWLILSGNAFDKRGALEVRMSSMQFGAAE